MMLSLSYCPLLRYSAPSTSRQGGRGIKRALGCKNTLYSKMSAEAIFQISPEQSCSGQLRITARLPPPATMISLTKVAQLLISTPQYQGVAMAIGRTNSPPYRPLPNEAVNV